MLFIITGLLRFTVEAKDTYTRGHSDRVSAFSVLLGEKLGVDEDTKEINIIWKI